QTSITVSNTVVLRIARLHRPSWRKVNGSLDRCRYTHKISQGGGFPNRRAPWMPQHDGSLDRCRNHTVSEASATVSKTAVDQKYSVKPIQKVAHSQVECVGTRLEEWP